MDNGQVGTAVLAVHVVAASIWVGGQVVLAAVVPALRRAGSEVSRAVGRAYARLAWPAFGVLLLTGGYNVATMEDGSRGTLVAKLVLVAVSGVGALAHQLLRRPAVKGAAAGLGLLAAVGALVLGVILGSHG